MPHFPGPAGPGGGDTKWVKPATYYDDLPAVMKQVPPLPGEEALYGWIAFRVGGGRQGCGHQEALVESFVAADAELVDPLFQFRYNGRSDRKRLDRAGERFAVGHRLPQSHRHRQIEHVPEHARGNPVSIQGVDSQGQPLDGNNQYTITFAKGQRPPVKGFWSLTLYNADHLFHPNPLQRFSLGTKNKTLQENRGRFADALPGRQVPWQGQGNQLAARAHRPVLVAVAQLLARSIDHRRQLGAARRCEGALIALH